MQVIPVTYFEQPHLLSVGEYYEGGVIGFVTGSFPNQQAIVITPTILTTARWGSTGVDVVGTSYDLFTGLDNTNLIVASEPLLNSAAKAAREYNGGGFTDWCLPSASDLERICNNNKAGLLPMLDTNTPNASWSSTQYSDNNAWWVSIRDGSANCEPSRITFTKSAIFNVRPVRYVYYSGNTQQS
jgi:hypothetical protein